MENSKIIPSTLPVPQNIARLGEKASMRFLEFFTVRIRNRNTRMAYVTAVKQFIGWCDQNRLAFEAVLPIHVAAYIERHPGSPPTIRQHLAAIRMVYDWMVLGGALPRNPSSCVRGPKHKVTEGQTPAMTAVQAKEFFKSLNASSLKELRDMAILTTMLYSFARVSAVCQLKRNDFIQMDGGFILRLLEKGGKCRQIPVHPCIVKAIQSYLAAVSDDIPQEAFLFQTLCRGGNGFSGKPLHRNDVLRMIKKRVGTVNAPSKFSCHSFRTTGITLFLENGGDIQMASRIAGHESTQTTRLYDRRSQEISLDAISKIEF